MRIQSVHPGFTVDDVVGTMGFSPIVPEKVPFTEPPDAQQLKLIRDTIDPDRMYMG